ncbi:MAG: hypothetical protein CMN87_17600 [Stappia sp.]|uniref:hypothetical protein n=1 Tax=Stappia sp. TaxID=1870903 RepID=UPI000C50CEAA|nr:hypothetical protein [Stappia sp.]MAA96703.1 hypothetical protein [Stappia sp.]MBM21821.1 hypothetical protein [Stappia sp.]
MTFIHDLGEINRHRVRDVALAGIVALAVVGGVATVVHTVTVMAAQQTATIEAAPKTDRLDTLLPSACAGQSWGNWSADCVSAISGKTASMRQVRFETIESRDLSARTSVLARVPVNS